MPHPRFAPWTLLAAAGFALASLAAPTPAQDKKDDLPKRPPAYSNALGYQRTAIQPEKLAAAKADFKAVAAFFAEYVAHPRVYSAPQEFRSDIGPNTPQPEALDTLLGLLRDIVLMPHPVITSGTRVSGDNAVYINELAAELDAALAKVVRENPTPVVRLNATRMLAVAARSGAKVHYPTVTELLTNANTPPEVKYYAYQAAANLLAAYDFADYRSRKHSIADIDKVALSKLVKVVNDAVVAPVALATGGAKGQKPADPTPEQLAVHAFVRREAVRALAKVRFASVLDQEAKTMMYPIHTLARVATSDPALQPAPGPAEIAEAVIGICNMTPTKGYNADAVAEVVATGLKTYAGPRAGNPADRSVAWKVYSARLSDGMRTWRGLFDNTFDPANPAKFDPTLTPNAVNNVATNALNKVLGPIDRNDRVDIASLTGVLDELKRAQKRNTALFPGDAAKTTLDTLAK